jgi:hypothetical protein
MTDSDSINFYKKNQPIGCRDMHTTDLLNKLGVKAYFSGCLTLTLKRPDVPKNDSILLVDCDPSVVSQIQKSFNQIKIVSPIIKPDTLNREFLAELLLEEYAKAKLVITSRLHCALPCLAFKTPVIFIHPNLNDIRFSGLLELVNHCTPSDFLQNNFQIDINNLDKYNCQNNDLMSQIKQNLIQTCEMFTRE